LAVGREEAVSNRWETELTTANLIPDLQRDEGLRLDAYPDPLSGGDPWTIGYGHTGPDVHAGLVWTPEQATAALQADIATAENALSAQLPWWTNLDDLRQDVMVNMTFNMGIATLLQFHNTLAAIQAGNWQAAHDGMLASAWAHQVGARAQRLAEQMLTDVHQ
jgi:lysozyme